MSFVSICKDSILCNHLQKHNKDFAEDVFFLSCHLIIGEQRKLNQRLAIRFINASQMAHKYNAIFVKLLIISRKQYIQMAHKWLV